MFHNSELFILLFRVMTYNGTAWRWGVPNLRNVIRLPVTGAKFITKSSLIVLLPGIIRRPGLKPDDVV